ncbi:MAG TPA: hypothetical protein PLL26_05690 [Candidatus Dojkabacteria bacterium]|nr:hypothetical protein [Candidatus Dojkabacteria bacterium]
MFIKSVEGKRIIGVDIKHSISDLIVYLEWNEEQEISNLAGKGNSSYYFKISQDDLLTILNSVDYDAELKKVNVHLRPRL